MSYKDEAQNNYPGQRSQAKGECMLYDSICIQLCEIQTHLWNMKYIIGFLGTKRDKRMRLWGVWTKFWWRWTCSLFWCHDGFKIYQTASFKYVQLIVNHISMKIKKTIHRPMKKLCVCVTLCHRELFKLSVRWCLTIAE